jgi:hypothetical protein
MTRKRYGRRWRQPTTAAGLEPHDRHCRSRRSIGHSPDPRFSRRDDARRRSYLPRDRWHWSHSAPRIARGCIRDPDHRQPDRAYTIRTRRQAVLRNASAHSLSARQPNAHNLSSRSSKTQIREQSSTPRPPGYAAGDNDRNNADNGDDEFALLRSSQMLIAMHSRQRLYAYCLPSYCFGERSRCDQRPRDQGRSLRRSLNNGARGSSGPTALMGRCVAGMWRRNAVITMRYAVMHETFPCAIQSPTADKCEE